MKDWPSPSSLPDLSDHQREQYAAAAHGCLGIIGGRPGGGKTWALARIIKALPSGRLAVCGPTGKAAVRVTETLQRAGVQGVRATTIHSLLGPGRDDEDNWAFEYDETNPLDLDWIFCDESSMVDTSLLGSLLAARAPGARVMLIGDVNQLAPVGVGAPLRDLIKAGLPYGELVEIHRNAGRVVRCCHGIIDKHQFEPSPKLDLSAESPENLLHVETREPEQQIERLKTVLDRFRQGAKVAVRHDDGTIEQRGGLIRFGRLRLWFLSMKSRLWRERDLTPSCSRFLIRVESKLRAAGSASAIRFAVEGTISPLRKRLTNGNRGRN